MNPKSESEHEKPKLVRSLMDIPLEKESYEADLAVTDRYQQFSAEILRLALGGIGVFGFVLKDVLHKNDAGKYDLTSSSASWCYASGLVVLAISAGCSLAHRYYASDCIGIQISYLRAKGARDERLKSAGKHDATVAMFDGKMGEEKTGLGQVLKRCAKILVFAAMFLCLGIGLIASGLALTLFQK